MRIMGRPRALVAVVAGAFLLAGCGSGPSQVGAAAFVGDTVISLDKVQELIDKAVSEQPYARKLAAEHKLDILSRMIISQLITHELVVRTARQEGVAADEGQVAQALSKNPFSAPVTTAENETTGAAQVAARVIDTREELTDLNLEQQLANKMATKLEIIFDYYAVSASPNPEDPTAPAPDPTQLRSQAISIAQQYAADPAGSSKYIQDLATKAKAANAQPNGETGVKSSLGDFAAFDTSPLFWTPENNVVAFQQPGDQSGGWFVAAIRKRTTTGVTSTTPRQPLGTEQALGVGGRMVQEFARTTNVKVNPRYGTWDVVSMSVGQTPAVDSTIVVPFGTPLPAGQ